MYYLEIVVKKILYLDSWLSKYLTYPKYSFSSSISAFCSIIILSINCSTGESKFGICWVNVIFFIFGDVYVISGDMTSICVDIVSLLIIWLFLDTIGTSLLWVVEGSWFLIGIDLTIFIDGIYILGIITVGIDTVDWLKVFRGDIIGIVWDLIIEKGIWDLTVGNGTQGLTPGSNIWCLTDGNGIRDPTVGNGIWDLMGGNDIWDLMVGNGIWDLMVFKI